MVGGAQTRYDGRPRDDIVSRLAGAKAVALGEGTSWPALCHLVAPPSLSINNLNFLSLSLHRFFSSSFSFNLNHPLLSFKLHPASTSLHTSREALNDLSTEKLIVSPHFIPFHL